MNPDKNIFRLKHILDSINKINIITEDVTYENFKENWIVQDVVVRNLEIIGEASNHVDENIRAKFPNVAWNEIRGLRNIIVHVYFELDSSQIWNTIQHNIPELKIQINQILTNLEK